MNQPAVTPKQCKHRIPHGIPCMRCQKEKKDRREAMLRVQEAARKLDW